MANLKSLTLKFQNLKSLTLKLQNLKSLTLTQKFPIWTQNFWILMIFVTNLKKILPKLTKIGDISKFDEITKFEILNPKIQNFQFRQNLTKNQNSATVVYHNFAISPKFERQNFPKLVRILANNPYKLFSKFWSRYQNPKITKIGSHHQNFEENS